MTHPLSSDATQPPVSAPAAGSGVPPLLPSVGAPPVLAIPPGPGAPSNSLRRILAAFLSVCLALFLADGLVSLADDLVVQRFGGFTPLSALRAAVSLSGVLCAVLAYLLIGLTPWVPKRLMLPFALFNPLTALLGLPMLILLRGRAMEWSWVVSVVQLACGVALLAWARHGLRWRWPLVGEDWLRGRGFSARNLLGFLGVNLLLLPPLGLVYGAWCVSLAVGELSEGFLALRPAGLMAQTRTYTRDDGRAVTLVPMAHVGNAHFYQQVATSFPTNATILLEGVSDHQGLLTNRLSYRRMASSLGLAEQHEAFRPNTGELVPADVDVSEFSTNTIGLLNVATYFHAHGLTPESIRMLLQAAPPPGAEDQLLDDILHKRNRHLLKEIHARLPRASRIIVPWGAAHMPELGRELEKAGFRVTETREQTVIAFRRKAAGR